MGKQNHPAPSGVKPKTGFPETELPTGDTPKPIETETEKQETVSPSPDQPKPEILKKFHKFL